MFEKYFEDYDIKDNFQKEFICIFNGWLGRSQLHKLDEVTAEENSRFSGFLRILFENFTLYRVNKECSNYTQVTDIENLINYFETDNDRDSCSFIKLIIDEIEAVITEEWDYTWILWHQNNGAKERIIPLVKASKLFNFNDN